MAGKITVSTINDSSGVLATQNGMTGIAKAWVLFNGAATPVISGSFNVSSITYNSTGTYTVNFSTSMPSTAYSIVSTAQGQRVIMGITLANIATGSCQVTAYDMGGSALFNSNPVSVVVFSS